MPHEKVPIIIVPVMYCLEELCCRFKRKIESHMKREIEV
jgi:hypothetical protein